MRSPSEWREVAQDGSLIAPGSDPAAAFDIFPDDLVVRTSERTRPRK
jgi:hypothetical protein